MRRSLRRAALLLAVGLATERARGAPQTLTVPAAASIHGLAGTFFHSDLWVTNRSYVLPVTVTATYRCYAGLSCGRGTATFSLAPRQTRLLSDVVATLFEAPETAGAIELSWDDASGGPVAAASRSYTPSLPAPTYGQQVPALAASQARSRALFLGLGSSGGDLSTGFRSNAGAFNPNVVAVPVTFTLSAADGTPLGAPLTRTFAPKEAYQLNDVFRALSAGGTVTSNAVLIVSSPSAYPVFGYAIVIDNLSGDSIWAPALDEMPALPASGALFGAHVAHAFGVPEETAIENTEAALGRLLDIDREYYVFQDAIPTDQERASADRGRLPFISWYPGARADGTRITWPDVASGKDDATLAAAADRLRDFARPIAFAFHHEPEDQRDTHGTEADFVAAWRHIHDLFLSHGATNVIFALVTYSSDYGDGTIAKWYPGDEYVDWLAPDGYNFFGTFPGPGGCSRGWRTFEQVFSPVNAFAEARHKPVVVAEWGCTEDPADPERKAQWLRDALATVKRWPRFSGLAYFDVNDAVEGCNWLPTTSPNATSAFLEIGADPYLNRRATAPPFPALLTIPASASIHGVGGTFFHSDLWLFNGSWSRPLTVTPALRCFAGQSCGHAASPLTLAPREARLVPDAVATLFGASEAAGAIELMYDAARGPLLAQTRSYTPAAPAPTYGQLIPSFPSSAATSRALFLGLANAGGIFTTGFRSNAGAYNPTAAPVTVTLRLADGDGRPLGSAIVRPLAPFEAWQVNDVFSGAGAGERITTDTALSFESAGGAVFPYAIVIDNQSGDSSYLAAGPDEPAP